MDISTIESKLIKNESGKKHYKDLRDLEDKVADALIMCDFAVKYAIKTAEHFRKIQSEINHRIGKIDIITPLESDNVQIPRNSIL